NRLYGSVGSLYRVARNQPVPAQFQITGRFTNTESQFFADPPTWAAGATLWVAGDRCFIRTGRGRRRYPCSEGAAGNSTVHPLTGEVSFDVPVTSWGYRGTEIPFSLTYRSRCAIDPELAFYQPKHPAALSDASSADNYNPRWTHSFAQWVEVL